MDSGICWTHAYSNVELMYIKRLNTPLLQIKSIHPPIYRSYKIVTRTPEDGSAEYIKPYTLIRPYKYMWHTALECDKSNLPKSAVFWWPFCRPTRTRCKAILHTQLSSKLCEVVPHTTVCFFKTQLLFLIVMFEFWTAFYAIFYTLLVFETSFPKKKLITHIYRIY